jgi:hypothetical protein
MNHLKLKNPRKQVTHFADHGHPQIPVAQTWTPIFFVASKHGHPQITVLIHLLLCLIITLGLKDLP